MLWVRRPVTLKVMESSWIVSMASSDDFFKHSKWEVGGQTTEVNPPGN